MMSQLFRKFILKLLQLNLIFVLGLNLHVNAQNYPWVNSSYTIPPDLSIQRYFGVHESNFGDVFVTGNFTGLNCHFGSCTTCLLTNPAAGVPGPWPVFLTKYNANGNAIWAIQSNTTHSGQNTGYAVTSDANGNVYICGSFTSNNFSIGTLTATSMISGMFVAKFNPTGNIVWLKSPSFNNNSVFSEAFDIKCDPSGNLLVTGYFGGGTGSLIVLGNHTLTLSQNSCENVFITKMDNNGNFIWAKSVGGLCGGNTKGEGGLSLAIDPIGNPIITGYFTSPLVTFGTNTLTKPNNGFNTFIAKYDSNGNVLWAKSGSGSATYPMGNMARSVSTDQNGNIYIAGYFEDPVFTLSTFSLNNQGQSDAYIAKLDGLGNIQWAIREGAGENDAFHSISTNSLGIFALGGFSSSTTINGNTITTDPNEDPSFIVNYNFNGLGLCTNTLSSNGGSQFRHTYPSIFASSNGYAFIAGNYGYVNNFIVGTNTLTLGSARNAFVAKYQPCNLPTLISNENKKHIPKYYPNPVNTEFLIESEEEISKIEINNLVGIKLFEKDLIKGINKIDLSSLTKGQYIIKIYSKFDIVYSRILIE